MTKRTITACAAMLACLVIALPLAACSKDGSSQQGADSSTTSGSGNNQNSSAKRIVGKVTAIVGNQVTLAVGNLNMNRGNWQKSSSSTASSAASSGTSSSLITYTGETENVLIPVGMSIIQGGMGGAGMGGRFGGTGSGGTASGSQRRNFSGRSGGTGQAGGMQGGGQMYGGGSGQQRTGGGNWQGGPGGTVSGSGANGFGGGTARKTTDFSSIKTGMILQITEEPSSDGSSYKVTTVRIISST